MIRQPRAAPLPSPARPTFNAVVKKGNFIATRDYDLRRGRNRSLGHLDRRGGNSLYGDRRHRDTDA